MTAAAPANLSAQSGRVVVGGTSGQVLEHDRHAAPVPQFVKNGESFFVETAKHRDGRRRGKPDPRDRGARRPLPRDLRSAETASGFPRRGDARPLSRPAPRRHRPDRSAQPPPRGVACANGKPPRSSRTQFARSHNRPVSWRCWRGWSGREQTCRSRAPSRAPALARYASAPQRSVRLYSNRSPERFPRSQSPACPQADAAFRERCSSARGRVEIELGIGQDSCRVQGPGAYALRSSLRVCRAAPSATVGLRSGVRAAPRTRRARYPDAAPTRHWPTR